jgi:ribosomal protein S18 acetylase RimI-like enzyme
MPVSIRPLAETDLDAAAVILTSAFQRTGDWGSDLRFYHGLQPDGYFGAYKDGVLVGMVGATIYSTFAYIGMMGVHQQFQRRGIGLALMQSLLNWLAEKNVTMVQLDASPAGQPMYEKLGFEAQEQVFALEWKHSFPVARFSQVPGPVRPSDLAELVEIDARIFGAERGKIFSVLLETYPGRSFLLRNALGKITGYLFLQKHRVGPWVMLEPDGTEALLLAALSTCEVGSVSVLVPELNQRALALLRHYGFEVSRINRHMVRGSGALGDRNKIFGQTSLSLG